MYIKQGDIFWGMSSECIKKIMARSHKRTYGPKETLFREGEPIGFFYSLVKGRIQLSRQEIGQTVYTVSRAGEAFGWSSLIGRDIYSATAETVEPSTLMEFSSDDLMEILNQHPQDGLTFFRRLAKTLGDRLLNSYQREAEARRQGDVQSQGTGQVLEASPAD
ncbi:MAG TPA: Crp/Fnr family transcriptional regulator [Desulfobacterales bacterium]